MSCFKTLLSIAAIVASFAGAAHASPYFPFIAAGSGESAGAPFSPARPVIASAPRFSDKRPELYWPL